MALTGRQDAHKQRSHAAPSVLGDGGLPLRETALYISDMILDLRNMAKSAQLTPLQSMLELCYYEAFAAANKVEVPSGEVEYLQNIGEDARRAEG